MTCLQQLNHFDKSKGKRLFYDMASQSLQEFREVLKEAYLLDLVDLEEFALMYQNNLSRIVFPYWKFDRFDLDAWDDSECYTELRFRKNDLPALLACLRIPGKIVCSQRTTCSGLEALCILLKRLAFPCRYTDMVTRFGRNITELCLIFNAILNFVYTTHQHHLSRWEQPFLSPENLALYTAAIHNHGAPLENCFGFIDGTVRRIARPKINQRTMYNGHKRVHSMKFQSVVIPNGLIANLLDHLKESAVILQCYISLGFYRSCNSMLFMTVLHFVFMVTLHTLLEFIFKVHSKIANSHLKCKTTIRQ